VEMNNVLWFAKIPIFHRIRQMNRGDARAKILLCCAC
jgi:hypothetical protein